MNSWERGAIREERRDKPAPKEWHFYLACGVIAAALGVAWLPGASSASELKWRSGRNALKNSDQAVASDRLDQAVRPAAFADEAVRPTADSSGRVHFRTLLQPNGPNLPAVPSRPFRSAQLPTTPSETTPPIEQDDPGPNAVDLPPLDAPDGLDFDMPPQPEDDTLQLDQNQRRPLERQPSPEPALPRGESLDIVPGGPLPERTPTPSIGTMEAEQRKAEEACEQGLADLQAKTIDTLVLSIAVTGTEGSDYPFECSLDDSGWHEGRYWEQTTYLWKASALCHKPLFFEDEHLERYGHSWAPLCQPLISGAHFFTRLPILPYCMGVEPPNECIYALGHYRPGSCAPYMCNPVPLSWRGALFQAGAVVGAAAVLP